MLTYHYTNEEAGQRLRRYWTDACRDGALKASCTTGKERRIARWEHEHVLEEVQRRLDNNPQAMRQRRETVQHPFGTMKARMGATHFLTKTLPKVFYTGKTRSRPLREPRPAQKSLTLNVDAPTQGQST
jgi:hypothetical protein